jgi:transposase
MSGFRRPEVLREQRLEDAIPVDHPVRLLDMLLKSQAFDKTFRDWEAQYVLLEGKPPYHPRDLSGLYIYGMMNKLRSSRQLEGACHHRLDVIWLLSGQRPDHSTIAEFVKAHSKPLRQLFRDALQVAVKAGLVKLDHVSVDGTKIEADAGKGSVHKQETIVRDLARVDAQLAALEKEWTENETRESRLLGPETPWVPGSKGSLPQRLSQMKRQQERLKEALAAIERRAAESASSQKPKAIASVTDPASRAMPDKEGKSKPNYNAQLATDTTAGVIVAHQVNDRAEDSGQLIPMLDQVEENAGRLPAEASADSGYNTGPELDGLEKRSVTGYLPASRERSDVADGTTPASQAVAAAHAGAVLTDAQWEALPKEKGKITKEAFRYDPAQDAYVCPMGQSLPFLRFSSAQRGWGVSSRAQYGGCAACATCARAAMCCTNTQRGRIVNRDQYEGHRERMRARMKTDQGRSRYRLRGPTIEPRFGQIKRGLGVRRFMRRGLEAVRTEWSLVCTALNVAILLKQWSSVMNVL